MSVPKRLDNLYVVRESRLDKMRFLINILKNKS